MKDPECVRFLQWALPQLHMRWSGFRKVYAQVCKRLCRRIHALQLADFNAYRQYLQSHSPEWQILDSLCYVTITRFYRDKSMFAFLENDVMPVLAKRCLERGQHCLKAWSLGCGMGEEAYSIALLWQIVIQSQFPGVRIQIMASDSQAILIERARQACYSQNSIKNLPRSWFEQSFVEQDGSWCLKQEYRDNVKFVTQDVRQAIPEQRFDLVFCRNLVFTYFDEALQCRLLQRLHALMFPGAALVIGIHERLPTATQGFVAWSERLGIFMKTSSESIVQIPESKL